MYIRQVKKQRSKTSKVFYQYTLAQSSRLNGKVKQTAILYLGSDTLLEDKHNRQLVLQMLKAMIFGQEDLFPSEAPAQLVTLANAYYEKYRIKYSDGESNPTTFPPARATADYQPVDIAGLDVEDAREFGAENLCKHMLDTLDLESFLASEGGAQQEIRRALIAIAARAVYAASEHKTSQILTFNSELAALYHEKPLTHKQLYRASDFLYRQKDQIDRCLYNRISDLFDIRDNLVIFDISNTYFETSKRGSRKARHGKSKEKRTDCPLVVFTGVINKDGFIRHSRIYEGNKPDAATLSDMIEDMENYSPATRDRTLVMDAGIATEDNLELVRQKGYNYVCVSRTRLKDYPLANAEGKTLRLTRSGKEKVELKIFHPPAHPDTWMYVESEGKRKKEMSISEKLRTGYEEELLSIRASLTKKGGTKKIEKVWERIGRAKQKYHKISARYNIKTKEKDGLATEITWTFLPHKVKDDKTRGVYFIRTNLEDCTESRLWDIYNTIRDVEATFRSLKSDLNLRPLHHQNDERIDAHIYLTILAYQLVNTIRYMLKSKGIHDDWRNIVRILSTHKIQTVKLPSETKDIYIRKPSKPLDEVKKMYDATRCSNTQTITKKYVVYH